MKSTGITRRIDDLGRIVIPKEIRKNLRLKDGELLEIFIDNEDIVLKRFSNISNMNKVFDDYVDILNSLTGCTVIITDTEKVVSSSKNQYLNKKISEELEEFLQRRSPIFSNSNRKISIIDGIIEESNYYIVPLIINSDVCGLLILLSKKDINDQYKMMIEIVSKIITKYME